MNGIYELKTEKNEYLSKSGELLVKSAVTLPHFTEDGRFAEKANTFYGGISRNFGVFCEKKLKKRALKRPPGLQNAPFGAVMKAKVTYADEEYVSVIIDTFLFDGVKRGGTARVAQVWNRTDAFLESADRFMPPELMCRVTEIIASEARGRESQGTADYKSRVGTRIASRFSPVRFYLTPSGIAFFYDPGELSESPFPEVFIVKIPK